MANKKITDVSTITSMAGTDKLFVNSGGDLKQIALDTAIANSTPVQTLNSNLTYNVGQIIKFPTGTPLPAIITNGKKAIIFSVFLPRQINNAVKTISVVCTNLIVRGLEGYILNQVDINGYSKTVCTYYNNVISVRIDSDTEFNTTMNNIPIAVCGLMTFTLA